MLNQTLTLQLQSQLNRDTLLQIFADFAPQKVAVRKPSIFIQIVDPRACADLIKKVKNGSFPDLKPEIFEILDSPANAAALLENCPAVFTTPAEVHAYFKPKEDLSKLQLGEEMKPERMAHGQQETEIDQYVKINLLSSVYEPTAKIEVQFDDSGLHHLSSPAMSSPLKEEVKQEPVLNDFSSESVQAIVVQHLQEKVNNNATNTPEQIPQQSYKIQTEQAGQEMSGRISSLTPAKDRRTFSACMTVILVVWVLWLMI